MSNKGANNFFVDCEITTLMRKYVFFYFSFFFFLDYKTSKIYSKASILKLTLRENYEKEKKKILELVVNVVYWAKARFNNIG